MNISEELEFLYSTLLQQKDVYMLESIIQNSGKTYCCDDVHRWGRTEEGRSWYGKLKDLVRSRVMERVDAGKGEMDRALALELCKPFGEIEYADEGVFVLSEADRRLLKRAGVLDWSGE